MLKIGLLIDSVILPAWIIELIKKINTIEFFEIKLIILNNESTKNKYSKNKMSSGYKRHFYNVLTALDRVFSDYKHNALKLENSISLIADIPQLILEINDQINSDITAEIKKYNIDVFLQLGKNKIQNGVSIHSKNGIWTYDHGNNDNPKNYSSGFWEVINYKPLTCSCLHIYHRNNEKVYKFVSNVSVYKSIFGLCQYKSDPLEECIRNYKRTEIFIFYG